MVIAVGSVSFASIFNVLGLLVAIARLTPLPTVLCSVSVPPEAVTLSPAPVPDLVSAALIVPKPDMVPFEVVVPRVTPELSVSVPPFITIVPSVTFCALLIVTLQPVSIFSV